MLLTVDVIENFVATLPLVLSVKKVEEDGNNKILTVEGNNPLHVRKGLILLAHDRSEKYEVSGVTSDGKILVPLDSGIHTFDTLIVPPFHYFHGTPTATNASIVNIDEKGKVPMVYLLEVLKETDLGISSGIKRESEVRLFLLDNADFERWDTDDHYSKRLIGLNRSADLFISELRKNTKLFEMRDAKITRINHTRFGTYLTNNGYEKRFFEDNLTGVELSFTLNLMDCNN